MSYLELMAQGYLQTWGMSTLGGLRRGSTRLSNFNR
jgi:hypothetical protein